MLLASCKTTGDATKPDNPTIVQKPPQEKVEVRYRNIVETKTTIIDTACDWVKPIFVSGSDNLTDGTARQILAHNKTYVANCGDKRDKPSN